VWPSAKDGHFNTFKARFQFFGLLGAVISNQPFTRIIATGRSWRFTPNSVSWPAAPGESGASPRRAKSGGPRP
jgi:hypothetical protein